MSELKPRQFSEGEEAGWLADKVCILGDYGKDAARVLRKQADELEQLRARNAELERQLKEMTDERDEQARLNGMGSEREAALMGKVAELERQLAEAEQRIAESQRQKPVCWIEADPSAKNESAHNVFCSMIYSTAICVTKPERGNPTWALYAIPIVPPAIEEAVNAEREACAAICDGFADGWGKMYKEGHGEYRGSSYYEGKADAADYCSAAIHARSDK